MVYTPFVVVNKSSHLVYTPDLQSAVSTPREVSGEMRGIKGCRRCVVVSGVRRMNEVNARRARLVPGWVTVFGRVYRLGM